MRQALMTAIAVCLLASVAPTDSGLHFEMLISCKSYGEAFNSGRKNHLIAACTPEFAAQWERVPTHVFHKLPRTGSGKLMGSLQTSNGGSVTVSTKQGIVTFVLLRTTYGWKVADIYRKNDDGSPISLKGYLDATLTANEFMTKLKRVGGSAYHENLTPEFRAAFESWPQEEVDRIRDFLPDPKPHGIPVVRLGDGAAMVKCRLPNGGPNEIVTFYLKDQIGWKIDDFSIQSRTTQIPSFRDALGVLAASMSFGEFCRDPKKGKSEAVAAPGPLRDALDYAKTLEDSPFPPPQKPLLFAISEDAHSAEMTYADRKVRISLSSDPNYRGRLTNVELRSAGTWASVADLILLKKRVSEVASFSRWLTGSKPEAPKEPVVFSPIRSPMEEPSVLVNAAGSSGPSVAETQPAIAQEVHGEANFAEQAGAVYVAPLQRTKRDPIRGASRRLSSAEMIKKSKEENRRRR
jgi:hypothetical protein